MSFKVFYNLKQTTNFTQTTKFKMSIAIQSQPILPNRRKLSVQQETFQIRKSSQCHSLLLARINSWVDQPIALEQLERYLQCIRKLQDLNNFHHSDLTVPVLIYAERFVRKNGILPKDKLFLLLLVGSGVAIKMLEEVKRNFLPFF
jgi:hypothetical protein